jgi:hypothetical protein
MLPIWMPVTVLRLKDKKARDELLTFMQNHGGTVTVQCEISLDDFQWN